MDVHSEPTAALVAANRRLQQLRETLQMERSVAGRNGRFPSPNPPKSAEEWPRLLAKLPAHLGWESAPLTALWRARQVQPPTTLANSITVEGGGVTTPSQPQPVPTVKLYPDIALGMLRTGGTAVGRLWLLCHHLDGPGCGKLRIDILVQRLTVKTSALRLCGKRQLRNLLRDGEGVYWTRDRQHIWLRSAAKVAGALGVERLTGWPVALPVAVLLGGIGDFRAHLYAAFHSGRAKAAGPEKRAMPIARDTLANLSGVGRSSQRAYEARLNLPVRPNFAVGEAATAPRQEERAWEQGGALFTLCDYSGQQGGPGKVYLAWQLPNSYAGQHQRQPKGRQKRINRQLKDLVTQGMPGNDEGRVDTRLPLRRYCANGKLAAQQAGKRPGHDFYWCAPAGNGRSQQIWRQLRLEA